MITKNRKIFFLALFVLAGTQLAVGQIGECVKAPSLPVVSIETPNGSPVSFVNEGEALDTYRNDQDSLAKTHYPNVELINTYEGNISSNCYSSSSKFNCHGYAWHMAQLSEDLNTPLEDLSTQLREPVFIPSIDYGDPNAPYLTDGSYEEYPEWIHPAIIWYSNSDHSAITTDTKGVVISKWFTGPLVKHAVNEGDYTYELGQEASYGIKYYIVPDYCDRYYYEYPYSITGPSEEYVKQAIYSVNIMDYDSVVWQFSSNFSKSGESHNSITLDVNCNSGYSRGWVSATVYHTPNITMCADTVELPRKYVYTGKPLFSYEDITFENTFGSPAYYLCNSHYDNYYNVENKYDATSFDVQICNLNGQVIYQFTTSYTRRSINYTNLNGYYLFRIRGTNSCGTGDWCEIEFEYRDCSTGGETGGETGETGDYGDTGINAEDLLFGPNPADDETTITISNDSDIDNTNFNSNDSWSIEVYNELGILVKKQVNLYGNEHTINTADFKTGIYIVIAKNNNEILRSKLRIAR